MHRLERLINLVAALLDAERPLTVEELRERLPGYAEDKATFRRAFERDKETLRDLGVPIVLKPVSTAEPGVEGYRIPKEAYYLRDPGLAPDELAALHLAASAVRLEGSNGVEALWKLGGEVAEGGPAPAVAALPGATHLAPLFAAISSRRRVIFAYRGRVRSVAPYRLSFRNGHWYLVAAEDGAGEGRSYRLDRIESDVTATGPEGAFAAMPAEAGGGPGSPRPGLQPPWELGGGEPVTARLLVDAEQAGWAVGHVGRQAVEEWRSDGSVVLSVPVANRDAFRSFVLGFLHHAEVLGPAELRADMVAWLEELCRG